MSLTNITEDHKLAFEALKSDNPNFALMSCFIDGEPTATIAFIREYNNEVSIIPLFVAVTDKMKITDHNGVEPT